LLLQSYWTNGVIVRMLPLACWDYGFETSQSYGSLSGRGLGDWLITCLEISYRVWSWSLHNQKDLAF